MFKEEFLEFPSWIKNLNERPICDVPWLGTSVVLSDGQVQFCCYSPAYAGNVNDEPFEQIWNGHRMMKIRKSLSDQKLPEECRTSSCPIYRGDLNNHLVSRIHGPPSGSQGESLASSRRADFRSLDFKVESTDTKIHLNFLNAPDSNKYDLFVAIRNHARFIFFPTEDSFPIPSGIIQSPKFSIEFSNQLILDGSYECIEIGVFEHQANPNLPINCLWARRLVPIR